MGSTEQSPDTDASGGVLELLRAATGDPGQVRTQLADRHGA
jgi:hypothetical protein